MTVDDYQNKNNADKERTDEYASENATAEEGGNIDLASGDVSAQGTGDTEKKPMTIEEAARKGGQTTKSRYGPDFYSRIGRKGGQRVARERGPEFYSEIGRKGGEARVAQSRKLERQREPEE